MLPSHVLRPLARGDAATLLDTLTSDATVAERMVKEAWRHLHKFGLPTVSDFFAAVERDHACSLGHCCDCCPNISVAGPDAVTVIDEHGRRNQGVRRL
jgi:hypothetical protein